MQSPYSFIVTPLNERRYDNIKNISGIDFFTSTSEEDHTASNRFAKVISVPLCYSGEIKKGDTLLVHHNVFKFYNDMKGRRKSGKSFFRDNLFFVDLTINFFYISTTKNGRLMINIVLSKPIKIKEKFLKTSGSEEPLMGVIKYINNQHH